MVLCSKELLDQVREAKHPVERREREPTYLFIILFEFEGPSDPRV